MNMAAHERPGSSAGAPTEPSNSTAAQGITAGETGRGADPEPRPSLLRRLTGLRLSSQFGSHGLVRRGPALDDAARRELLMHGIEGTATILSVRSAARNSVSENTDPRTESEPRGRDRPGPGQEFWVRIQLEGRHAYETRVRQRVNTPDQEWMQPGDVVCCRVDPGDLDRVVLYVPAIEEASRTNIAKILADGRRARATVLAATPIAADYTGRDDPVLRLDLELHAWDEPAPWRVRIIQPVPLAALELVDLGRHLEIAFFTIDRGESATVDWLASRELD
ncbi:hypothetical protein OHB26_07875 [Nocardia sp. NBC_01503]|uniref:hypothetical protein n=1 Tax=Nocardia sp. NBC_01503 TaxID=2975997 RepID=UPI002E7C1693|nr:hypothetical protein [Nocardia sp. NBC_01503]WTL34121.1 hypothetical protein OHB26_07875 [Nocardia sp. NBC_01503]